MIQAGTSEAICCLYSVTARGTVKNVTDTMPSALPASPLKIVVIEDNDDVRELFVQSLAETGHTATGAADGPSGLDALLSFGPDVAFVDVGLPGFDGYEVARRARAAGPRARLVALTGYSRDEDKQRAVAAGFDEHLVKPLLDDDLQQSLERATPHPW